MTTGTRAPAVPGRPGPAAHPPTGPGAGAAAPAPLGGDSTATKEIRFAALGDSLTEGLGDPVAAGWRGWAPLLAQGLAAEPSAVRLLNCSRSGALTKDVVEEQLPRALEHRPHLASVVVGANDTLRGSFEIETVARRLDTVLAQLRAHGAEVLTACLPDPGRMLGLPWPLARPLGRRMAALNQVVHVLSERYGAVHLHAARHPWVAERASWSADRLHPSERGHRLLAREFHDLLAARGLSDGEPPSTTPGGPGPGAAASVWWMATKGTRWVADRCTDLLPDLLRLAGREARHRLAGTDGLLDLRSRDATAGALARLGGTYLGQ
ncbi:MULTISPECIES: SGNH/GDSL hydrolase family protein [unclassified Streptomyces]|uniref:SGNH/GDSL hydrolase family protein n=1 Tax=unclassified Streptomyces TaxID=2593676 RepID=UPI000381869C|nr:MULTISPECIES: SGNH/GDSL hydrolase family protein [unclassified Streptomyces]MYX39215.1 SGNH/GDSL hydrolase family protein [Streptomyces sp. SID8377]